MKLKYKLKCDKCPARVKARTKTTAKVTLWSYLNIETGKMEARCAKHLGK